MVVWGMILLTLIHRLFAAKAQDYRNAPQYAEVLIIWHDNTKGTS